MMGGEEETYYGFVWKNPKCTMEQLMNMILEYPELIEQGRKEYEKAQAQEKKWANTWTTFILLKSL